MSYKVLVLGDSGVGKTTYINRHKTGEFTIKYSPTIGVNVQELTFYTDQGQMSFTIWDCGAQDRSFEDAYFVGAQGAIIMADLTSRLTFKSIKDWVNKVKKICPGIPIIICGNKMDIKTKMVNSQDIQNYVSGEYYNISAKSNLNFESPFLSLARKFSQNSHLKFVERPAIMPPEVKIIPEMLSA